MSYKSRKAVYAGSFDPLTNGHLWMINQGLDLFDHLTVAIGINPDKEYTYEVNERIDILKKSLPNVTNIDISYFENKYLVDYATEIGASYILRGIRSGQDYEFEKGMRHTNAELKSDITTIFLMPPRDLHGSQGAESAIGVTFFSLTRNPKGRICDRGHIFDASKRFS